VSFPLSINGSIKVESPGLTDEKFGSLVDGLEVSVAKGVRSVHRSGTQLTLLARRWAGFNRLARILGGDDGTIRVDRDGTTIVVAYELRTVRLLRAVTLQFPSLPALLVIVKIVIDAIFTPEAYPFDQFFQRVAHSYGLWWPSILCFCLLVAVAGYLYKVLAFRSWIEKQLRMILASSGSVG
jgi:hypothetical protein